MPVKHEKTIKKVVLGVAISSLLAGCGSDGVANDEKIQNVSNSIATNTSSSSSIETSSTSVSSSAAIVHDFIEPTTQQKVKVIFSAESTDLSATEETTLSVIFKDIDSDEIIAHKGEITITSTCNDNNQSLITRVEDTNTFTYTPVDCSGNDNLILSGVWAQGVSYSKAVQLQIEEAAGSLAVTATSSTKLDINGIGNTADITFQLKTRSGLPMADEQVNFSITEQGSGAKLSAAYGTTDANGLVTVTVTAGSKPGSILIRALHANSTSSTLSETISIGTGLPQAKRFAFHANLYNPNAYNYSGGQKVSFTARATDSTGNPVRDGTTIIFSNEETGSMPTECNTESGKCSVDWTPTRDGGLPDDGRIQVAATINVAEEFNDNNNNFIFDDGDTIVCHPLTGAEGEPDEWGAGCVDPLPGQDITDLKDSYIDINESGAFEKNIDRLIDSNGNGQRDLGDGKWTGPNCQHSNPADYCSDESINSISYAKSITLILSKDDDPTVCSGMAGDESAELSIFSAESEEEIVFTGLSISDGNSAALNPDNNLDDCPTGNVLPAGTTVEFAAEFGTIKYIEGTTTIPGNIDNPATIDYSFTYTAPVVAADETQTDRITVMVTTPSPYEGAESKVHTLYWQIMVK